MEEQATQEQATQEQTTENQATRFTRRTALRAGAGMAAAWLALRHGMSTAAAQPAPTWENPESDAKSDNAEDQWEPVEDALGNTEGTLNPDGVFTIDLPRTDFKTTIFGVPVEADLGVDSEISFLRVGSSTLVKYELALLDDEVNPVLSSLIAQGLMPPSETLTALHNHYLKVQPNVVFLHGSARGDARGIAKALYKALASNTGTPFGHGDEPPGHPGFNVKQVEDIIGGHGMLTNGVLSVTVPRSETITQRGIKLPPSMQVESMFNFQSIGNGQVAVIGEFVLLASEVDSVARELREHGIFITALHNHELEIQPPLYYLHSWMTGPATRVASGMRAALNHTKSATKSATK